MEFVLAGRGLRPAARRLVAEPAVHRHARTVAVHGYRFGGVHADPDTLFASLDRVLEAQLRALSAVPKDALLDARYEKFRKMGRLGAEFLEAP